METVKRELDENREYMAAKATVDELSASKKKVDKRQKAKILYAMHRLKERGEL